MKNKQSLVSEVERLEKDLQESREKYQTLAENINDIVFELDNQGIFEYISPSVEKIIQFPVHEIIGTHFSQFIHPDDINGIQLGFDYNREGGIEPQTYRLKNRAGDWVYLSAFVQSKRRHGQPAGLLGVLTDVTRRIQAEEDLRKSEEYYRALTENSSDAVLAVREDGHIKYASPSISHILGYNVEELYGTELFHYVYSADSLQATLFFVHVCSSPGYSERQELRLRHKDGSNRHVEIIGNNALANSSVGSIIINIRDITDRKQNEARQKELEQELHLSSRLASIGQLAAGLAHEINNPLTSIIGFSNLIIRQGLPGESLDKMKIINTEAQRVARIVQGLLTFARQDEIQRSQADVHDILNQILQLRSYSLTANHIVVTTDFAVDLPLLQADTAQLQQVFLNIILNAEKEMIAVHNRGELHIRTEVIDSGIRISIKDDGPGINPENMPRLFTPFFTTRKVGEGSGLGLSICHGIVTRHGGKIYARSRFGQGATFFVELPVGE